MFPKILGHSILEQEDDVVMKNEKEIKKKLQPLQKRYGQYIQQVVIYLGEISCAFTNHTICNILCCISCTFVFL